MFNSTILDNIDLTKQPPEDETQKQYYYMAKAREYVRAESVRLGRALTYITVTFGCQMNPENEI